MPVRDFVRGPARPDSPGTNSPIPNDNKRQIMAERARVPVPVTRLNGSPSPSPRIQQSNHRPHYQEHQQQALTAEESLADEKQTRELFDDTNLEGVDDTATITSANDENAGSNSLQQQYHFRSHSGNISAARRLRMNEASIPDRFANPSTMRPYTTDYSEGDDGLYSHPQVYDENLADYEIPGDTEPMPWSEANLNRDLDRKHRNWQQIEAALRKSPNHQFPARQHSIENISPTADGADYNDIDDVNDPLFQDGVMGQDAPRSFSRLGERSRHAASRFSTPNPQPLAGIPPTPRTNAIAAALGPRPATVAGRPPSPQRRTRRRSQVNQEQVHLEDNYLDGQLGGGDGGGDIFDTTNLNAVESSTEQSIDPNTSYSSLRLSSLSPISSKSSKSKTSAKEEAPPPADAGTTTGEKRPITAFQSDYPPNILQAKTFGDLQSESFDFNPSPVQPMFPQQPPLSLDEKLNRLRTLTESQRVTFFSSLTIQEWEDSGDWLVQQFARLLGKTKVARHERREIAAVFEKEIARRHGELDKEQRGISNRLDEMRMGGLDVLKKHQS